MSTHTIILEQPLPSKNSRTWREYANVTAAMNGMCGQFERLLKDMYPTQPQISYSLRDLNSWIDSMPDLSALVFDPSSKTYIPCNKAWIKEQVGVHLRRQAGRG